ncbi:MAG: DUF4199 domain-containing protein [Flavobacteriales bacterium CG_4_9_14_3_um_filter_40_17]|nr:MAG: DUF4199 domain-containing protein [Flavobacteriales bacterium CG_4_9_14_3_um_filter_40_17]
MKKETTVPLKYGFNIAITLIAYFLIVKLFGLHENPWLRLFNGVIMSYGLYSSIKAYKIRDVQGFTYFEGFKIGIKSGFLATMLFTLFMGIYMFHVNPGFVDVIMSEWKSDYQNGAGILMFVLLVEGFASTLVLTLAFMQLFKKTWNISEKK